jgi:Ca-activated chloride channel family protein
MNVRRLRLLVAAALVTTTAIVFAQPFDPSAGPVGVQVQQQPPQQMPPQTTPPSTNQEPQSFKFRTGVELVNVNATVTDQSGRFASGLTLPDFRVYDDEQPQTVTHFSAERVPVSLGILLDTSGSMEGEKIEAARGALNRFLTLLTDEKDEVFVYRFDNRPQLIQGWTYDKRSAGEALWRAQPHGSTAMYDAVEEAMNLLQQAHNRKRALVIISDGNDTNSRTDVFTIKQMIRESEVLVYAVGIDAQPHYGVRNVPLPSRQSTFFQRGGPPIPMPFPFPGGRRPPPPSTPPSGPPPGTPGGRYRGGDEDRVNVAALRDITDDSGGRTEIIRAPRDLEPATSSIADELSKQYYLGYPAPGAKDGRWHAIRVEVRNPSFHVRARRGYVAGK